MSVFSSLHEAVSNSVAGDISPGDVVVFANPADDEVGEEMVVIEDRGERVLVRQLGFENCRIKPTAAYLKTDLVKKPGSSATPTSESVETQTNALKTRGGKKGFCISYGIVKPGFSEDGDFAESGWISQSGRSMDPDQGDIEDGVTAVDKAVSFLLQSCGFCVLETSGGEGDSLWWTVPNYNEASDGSVESRSFFPYGFTDDELAEIKSRVNG